MAIEWYTVISGLLWFGVDWNASTSNTSVSLTPIIYRSDTHSTDNYGGRYDETLSPDTAGPGSWSGLTYGSGSGNRQIDSFSTRTYNRRNGSSFTVTLTLSWNSLTGTFNGSYFQNAGSGSHSWTYTVPALPTYTVSYNANGGSGAPGNQTKTYGVNLTLSSTKPTRSGYTFSKWNTASNGSGTNYNPGASYTSNAALTLYAQWTINTYTITINPNGGSFTSSKNSTAQSTAQSYTVNYGSSITNISASRSGYMPAGWFTEASGGTKVINNGGSLNSISSSRTIYAHWTKEEEDPPPDPIYDIYTKIGGTWVPGIIWVKVNGTWQRSLETTLKVNSSWRKMKAQ